MTELRFDGLAVVWAVPALVDVDVEVFDVLAGSIDSGTKPSTEAAVLYW